MKTCPKCGVENIQPVASCVRCAAPLESPEDLLGVRADMPLSDRLPPTVIISGREAEHQHSPLSEYGGHIICPNCEVGNEPGWLFCQECGARLPKQRKASDEAPTVPEPVRPDPGRVPFEQKSPQSFATKVEEFDAVESVSPRPFNREVEEMPPPETSFPPASSADPSSSSSRKRMITNIVCTNCGTIQSGAGFYCTSCGAKLSSVAMRRIKEREVERPAPPSLRLITDGGEAGAAYALDRQKTTIGRSRADITFPHDGFMSGLHAQIVERDGRYYLVDENSRNGTFIRLHEEIELKSGDMLIVGKQVFKFEKR